jgi:phage shock protein PspC (stress-responsive transcriptional regulator)
MKKFYLSKDGMIFGVCQGLSDYTGWDVMLIRVVFLFVGPLHLLYCVLALCGEENPE